jgi:hypothetical protein
MADRQDLDEAYKAAAKPQTAWEAVLPAQGGDHVARRCNHAVARGRTDRLAR